MQGQSALSCLFGEGKMVKEVEEIIWLLLSDHDILNLLSVNSKTDIVKWKILSLKAKIPIYPDSLGVFMRDFYCLQGRYIELEDNLCPITVMTKEREWNTLVQVLFHNIFCEIRDDDGCVIGYRNYAAAYGGFKQNGIPSSKSRVALEVMAIISTSAAHLTSILKDIEEIHQIHLEIIPCYDRLRELFEVKIPYGIFRYNLKYVTVGNLLFDFKKNM